MFHKSLAVFIALLFSVSIVYASGSTLHLHVDKDGVATLDDTVDGSLYKSVGIADSRTTDYKSKVLATVILSFSKGKTPGPVNIVIDFPDHDYLSDSAHLGFVSGSPSTFPVQEGKESVLIIHFLQKSAKANFTKFNDFTIIGKPKDMQKVKQALQDMAWLESYYANLTGVPKLPPITIFTSEYTSHITEKGFMYRPNVIFLDKIQVANREEPNLQALLLHEIMHVYVDSINQLDDDNRAWIDEGLAEFADEYAMDNYILPQRYTLLHKYGNVFIDQDYYNRPSIARLRDANANLEFSPYWSAGPGYDFTNYGLAPLMWQRFHQEVGDQGMRDFFSQFKNMHEGETCTTCIGVPALDLLVNISHLSLNQLEYPYWGDPAWDTKIIPYAQRNLSRSERKQILAAATKK